MTIWVCINETTSSQIKQNKNRQHIIGGHSVTINNEQKLTAHNEH